MSEFSVFRVEQMMAVKSKRSTIKCTYRPKKGPDPF